MVHISAVSLYTAYIKVWVSCVWVATTERPCGIPFAALPFPFPPALNVALRGMPFSVYRIHTHMYENTSMNIVLARPTADRGHLAGFIWDRTTPPSSVQPRC